MPSRDAVLFSLVLLIPAAFAGCIGSPIGEAEAAHAGYECELGSLVRGFTASGAPLCAQVRPAFSCPVGNAVVGFAADGSPICSRFEKVADDIVGPPAETPPPVPRERASISLTSDGPIQSNVKTYTIASASAALEWGMLAITLDGQTMTASTTCSPGPAEFAACQGGAPEGHSGAVGAGDALRVWVSSGQTLRILDKEANSVMLTLTVG